MIDLAECARALVAEGKGILAADESPKTADKYLAEAGIKGGEEMRRKERQFFLEAPYIEEYVSGVILHDETLNQKNSEGIPFSKMLWEKGVVPGIKVDDGTEPIEESPDEVITKGLIGLPERLQEYRKQFHTGFTKWRAVIRIEGDRLPTSLAVVENAKRLALYAKYAQEAGMVAIVEPEVLYEGTHSRTQSRKVIEETLGAVVHALSEHAVDLSGILIKTSMTLSGKETGIIDSPEEVGKDTVEALLSVVPHSILGVVFLSGGQTPDQAAQNLNAIRCVAQEKNTPWPLTFSFARGLQKDALSAWQGKEENVERAQEVFIHRLKQVSSALCP